jgi:hypothetical protein
MWRGEDEVGVEEDACAARQSVAGIELVGMFKDMEGGSTKGGVVFHVVSKEMGRLKRSGRGGL